MKKLYVISIILCILCAWFISGCKSSGGGSGDGNELYGIEHIEFVAVHYECAEEILNSNECDNQECFNELLPTIYSECGFRLPEENNCRYGELFFAVLNIKNDQKNTTHIGYQAVLDSVSYGDPDFIPIEWITPEQVESTVVIVLSLEQFDYETMPDSFDLWLVRPVDDYSPIFNTPNPFVECSFFEPDEIFAESVPFNRGRIKRMLRVAPGFNIE